MSATAEPALLLHIGRNKAGSTTIQDLCAANLAVLETNGIGYVLLGHLAGSVPGVAGFETIAALADHARARGGTTLCSNEMLAAWPPALIEAAAWCLAGLDVRLLFYIRPYGAWLRSCYSYEVRGGHSGVDFDRYVEGKIGAVSAWPGLAAWGRAVGWGSRVRVRSTEAADLAGGTLTADFAGAVGLAGRLAPVPASNQAPHWMAVELLRLVAGEAAAPPGWGLRERAIAEALHELAEQAIDALGLRQAPVRYLTRDQAGALAGLYRRDVAEIARATGVSLAPERVPEDERGFLPGPERLPAALLRLVAGLARRPDYARLHPEMAEFAGTLERLASAARPGHLPRTIGRTDMSDAALMPGDARALAARGDFLGAIEAVPATEDAGLLAALAAWRLAAFDQARHPPGPASWPPALPDPFPGETGIPAIEAAALTPAVLGGAIAHHGCLRVNGLVDRDTAERLRDGIDRALAAQEAHHNGQPGTDPAWFTPLDVPSLAKARQFSAGCGACWTGDSPAMLVAVIEALRRSGVLATIEALLGERPALSVAKSSLRRVTPGALHDWHQDGAFLGRDVRPVNVWLALNECGRTAPGMDIVARRLPYIVQTQSHGACFGWSVGDGLVRMLEEGGAPVLTPEFGPGDALLFDHMMLHRTSMMAGLKGIRYAIESWFFAPTNYPYDQVPLYV